MPSSEVVDCGSIELVAAWEHHEGIAEGVENWLDRCRGGEQHQAGGGAIGMKCDAELCSTVAIKTEDSGTCAVQAGDVNIPRG